MKVAAAVATHPATVLLGRLPYAWSSDGEVRVARADLAPTAVLATVVEMRLPHRFRWRSSDQERPADAVEGGPHFVQIDPEQLIELSSVFSAPRWLRDLGFASWLLTGVAALLVGLTWLLGQTSTITDPVLVGVILATVSAPSVGWLVRRGVPRAVGALLVLVDLTAVAGVVLLLVLGGIASHGDEISRSLRAGVDNLSQRVQDAGIGQTGASSATSNVERTTPQTISTFLTGVMTGIEGVTSLAFGISFTILSLFFLLKDGPTMRRWVERHMGVPSPVARTITSGVIAALQRYFLGLTIIAAFNGVVVAVGALVLGVPLAGTIGIVTFVTAYVPFIGAFVAGAFAVLLALGTQGTGVAAVMLVIVLLANGLLQNIVQPIAYGATLRLNPLVVLVVTISAGALFGMLGMIVAAPLTSAAVHITAELARARAAAADPPASDVTSVSSA